MTPAKILVLGPRGQLGSDLLAAAADSDSVSTIPLDRAALDLREPDRVRPALLEHEFDVLVNCAGYTAVDRAESECATAFAVNAYAVEALAEACAERGRPLVHISTDYVFDGESRRPYTVDDPPAPINVYGASKLAGEALARRAHPEGTIIVRTSSLFGLAAVDRGGGNFVETMIRAGTERGRLRVVDDITMAPTGSADLARAILELIAGEAPPGVYHYASAGEVSWHGFAEAILEGAGLEVEVEPVPSTEYPTPARRPRYSVLDTAKTTAMVGPAPDWRDALSRYLAARSGRDLDTLRRGSA